MGKPEAIIETYLKKQVEGIKGQTYKFTSPGRRNVPDRICAFSTGLVAFVECKTDKGVLTEGQVREVNRLADLDQVVAIVHSKDEVDDFIDFIKEAITLRLKQAEEKADGKL